MGTRWPGGYAPRDLSCVATVRPMPQLSPFPFAAVPAADGAWLIASGELDMVTSPLLAAELDAADYDGVDLDAVTFMDVSGLRVLLTAARRARSEGRRFAVARPSPMIRRLLELTAIDQSIDVISDPSPAPTSL
jgi:anti-anti-sigma factor